VNDDGLFPDTFDFEKFWRRPFRPAHSRPGHRPSPSQRDYIAVAEHFAARFTRHQKAQRVGDQDFGRSHTIHSARRQWVELGRFPRGIKTEMMPMMALEMNAMAIQATGVTVGMSFM